MLLLTAWVIDEQHELEHTIVRWIKFMLESRNRNASLGSVSVLSPLSWCLVVYELLLTLNIYGTYCQGYTDDVTMIHVGKFTEILFSRMQGELNKIVTMSGEKGYL